MGWIAITRQFEILREEDGIGRPVQLGNEDGLIAIAQEDYGHTVLVDLINGRIFVGYESPLTMQNGTIEINSPDFMFYICDETNIVGELTHVKRELVYARDADGKRILEDGKYVKVRNDTLTPLTWRPIWFTRMTNGIPTKVIGAQTTLPAAHGGTNIKKLVSLFSDGRVGLD